MTTNLIDIQNSDVIMATSNMAENHPVGFQWVMKAKERGAKLIHVDPRYTRTSAAADLHVPLRSGTNIAFFGGLIRYAIDMVEKVCGIPKAKFEEVAKLYCSNSGPDKTGSITYALNLTQHTNGVENIRALCMLQLLLG